MFRNRKIKHDLFSVKTLVSWTFCEKRVAVKLSNFHTELYIVVGVLVRMDGWICLKCK